MKSSRIRGFDGLRALAFLLVFISHKAPSPVTDRYGTAGVWVFFVLSGFLITRILAEARGRNRHRTKHFRSSLSRFYVRRTARIFPVYYAFLAVVTVAGLWGLVEVGSPARQLSNWFYLSNIYIGLNGWETRLGHLWSLAVEEQFYLLFAPLVLACPLRQLHIACFSILGASFGSHAYLLFTGASDARFDTDSLVNFGLMAIGGLAGALGRPTPAPASEKGRIAGTHARADPRDARLVQLDRSLDSFRAFELRPQWAAAGANLPTAEWAYHKAS